MLSPRAMSAATAGSCEARGLDRSPATHTTARHIETSAARRERTGSTQSNLNGEAVKAAAAICESGESRCAG